MNKKGFTLLEILVYLAVALIIISVIVSFVLWIISSSNKNRIVRDTMFVAKRAMQIMTHEIKEADSVYTPTTTNDQLSLETKKYLPDQEKSSYIDFYICEEALCMKKEAQNPIIITPDNVRVSNLTFKYILSGGSQSIGINMTIDYQNNSGRPEYETSINLESSMSLRLY